MMQNYADILRFLLAKKPHDKKKMEELSIHENRAVRAKVAQLCTKKLAYLLDILSEDSTISVQNQVAKNRFSSREALLNVYRHGDKIVCQGVLNNPNCPDEIKFLHKMEE